MLLNQRSSPRKAPYCPMRTRLRVKRTKAGSFPQCFFRENKQKDRETWDILFYVRYVVTKALFFSHMKNSEKFSEDGGIQKRQSIKNVYTVCIFFVWRKIGEGINARQLITSLINTRTKASEVGKKRALTTNPYHNHCRPLLCSVFSKNVNLVGILSFSL